MFVLEYSYQHRGSAVLWLSSLGAFPCFQGGLPRVMIRHLKLSSEPEGAKWQASWGAGLGSKLRLPLLVSGVEGFRFHLSGILVERS